MKAIAENPKLHQIKFEIANVPEADKNFLLGILAIFTDPQAAKLLQLLRTGKVVLQYNPQDGLVNWQDNSPVSAATVTEIIHFVARFTDDEFEQLHRNTTFRDAFKRRDLDSCDVIVEETLGYKPKFVQLAPIGTG